MKNRLPVALAAACCILASLSFGRALASESNDGFVGRWKLVLNETTGDLEGLLELRREQGELIGRVEGGPIKVVTQGNRIEMVVDSRDAGARAFERTLTGALENGQLAGTYVSNEPGKAKAPPRTWRAVPYVEQNTAGQKPEPVDLSGVWFTTPLADLRKYSMSLTPQAEEWVKNYNPDLDQPALRCVSPGPVALIGWGYPIEIVQTRNEVIFFYEAYGQVRRVYTDGRKPLRTIPRAGWDIP